MGKIDLKGEMGIDMTSGQRHMTVIISVRDILGCSWALIGASGAQDASFRVPKNE